MKASELRIGNWVRVDDDGYGSSHNFQITYLDEEEDTNNGGNGNDNSNSSLIPISLTEDILANNTNMFKPWDKPYWTFNTEKGSDLRLNVTAIPTEWLVRFNGMPIKYINSVHELQNICYELLGADELKVKLSIFV